MPLAGEVFGQQHRARPEPPHRAIASPYLHLSPNVDGVLAPQSAMPIQKIPGSVAANGKAGGRLHRSALSMGSLGVDERHKGRLHVFEVGLSIGAGKDSSKGRHHLSF
jgi:hypothetical protein